MDQKAKKIREAIEQVRRFRSERAAHSPDRPPLSWEDQLELENPYFSRREVEGYWPTMTN
jgi:hypothetical protein